MLPWGSVLGTMKKLRKKEDKMSKRKSDRNPPLAPVNQPRFLVKDQAGVMIDIDGNDAGPGERHGKGCVLDSELGGGRIGDVATSETIMEGKVVRVYKNQDALDIMLRNQSITEAEYDAGRRFKFCYDLSGAYHVGTVKLEAHGGRASREDFLTSQINASRKVEEMINHLGGPETVVARALVNIIGKGAGLDYMFEQTGMNKNFWRGGVVSALGSLVGYFNKNNKKQ